MRKISFSKTTLIVSVFCAAMAIAASAQTFTTLGTFDNLDGREPGYLIQATDGNFYGVTYYGGSPTSCPLSGSYNCGTVYKVSPRGEVTTLYSFCSQAKCADGYSPTTLIQGSNGNFFGLTEYSGSCGGPACGELFEITPAGQLTTVHNFCSQAGCTDGGLPTALLQAANRNFYGVAAEGGAYDAGVVFELTPTGKFTTLYSFCANPKSGCPDGSSPNTLMQASNGNLYGATINGGAHNGGTIFVITPGGKLTTLLSLQYREGVNTMIQGADGNLYGTSYAGGTSLHGTVFELTLDGSLTYLHNFCGQGCLYGNSPTTGVVQGSDGNFYGTTNYAGITYYSGSLYGMSPSGAFDPLYLFCSRTDCPDGWGGAGLIQATDGNFYGMTNGGGNESACGGGCGTFFRLSMGLGPFVAAKTNFAAVGKVVTLLGNNLTGTTGVTFNGVPATFTVASDTYLQATVPTGATTGPIEVTTPSGTLSSNLPFQVVP